MLYENISYYLIQNNFDRVGNRILNQLIKETYIVSCCRLPFVGRICLHLSFFFAVVCFAVISWTIDEIFKKPMEVLSRIGYHDSLKSHGIFIYPKIQSMTKYFTVKIISKVLLRIGVATYNFEYWSFFSSFSIQIFLFKSSQ